MGAFPHIKEEGTWNHNPISHKPKKEEEGGKVTEETGEEPKMRAIEQHIAPHYQHQGDRGEHALAQIKKAYPISILIIGAFVSLVDSIY